MSLRYEIPDDDPERHRQWAKERNAHWESLAFEAMKGDASFSRWRRLHWFTVWTIALIVFAGLMWIALLYRSSQHVHPRAFAAPFAAASIVVGVGAWLYSRRIRSIGVAEWSRRRDLEREKKNA